MDFVKFPRLSLFVILLDFVVLASVELFCVVDEFFLFRLVMVVSSFGYSFVEKIVLNWLVEFVSIYPEKEDMQSNTYSKC